MEVTSFPFESKVKKSWVGLYYIQKVFSVRGGDDGTNSCAGILLTSRKDD